MPCQLAVAYNTNIKLLTLDPDDRVCILKIFSIYYYIMYYDYMFI